mmetsp:Transcript_18911/g.43879  ORF Transcript_18911/g.43879 Transcript_18911/m.43879 type:complete len:231 (-) Transcript_18911:718-1410(-)
MSWKANEPLLTDFKQIWNSTSLGDLKTPDEIFGSDTKHWYVRKSYVDIYDDIVNDHERTIHIVNGTAGTAKSCFLMYVLARCRKEEKPVLLYIHRNEKDTPVAAFFPNNSRGNISVQMTDSTATKLLEEWSGIIRKEESFLLIDGIVSFPRDVVPSVKYVIAQSVGYSLRSVEGDPMRRDRWLECWSRDELTDYASLVGIPNATETMGDNFFRIGGVCRYAFVKDAQSNQ